MSDDSTAVSRLLLQIREGDDRAREELFPLVYQELKTIARSRLARERKGHTLQPTALVHEVYLRLLGEASPQWSSRRHFFGAAAEAMRRILIDDARHRKRQKRGGDAARVTLDERDFAAVDDPERMLQLDDALQALERQDERMALVVKLRCFAGLTMDDIAEAMEISERTVHRSWTSARAWLLAAMSEGESDSGG